MLNRVFNPVRAYVHKLSLFQFNARLFLLNTIIAGVSLGVFRLLYNFYVLSLDYDEAMLGQLLTVRSTVALIGALPLGYISDKLGRKPSLLLATGMVAASILGMVVWPVPVSFFLMNVLFGLGQGLLGVTTGPFLMENSGEEERTYLFSFDSGIRMTAVFFGNWFGGRLPTWFGNAIGAAATSSTAYGWAIACVAGVSLLGLIPLGLLRRRWLSSGDAEQMISPFEYARRHPVLLAKLTAPMLITSLGAGLLMPFMNVFFRQVHHQSDAAIGTLFAWGSLSMAIGLLAAPPLADRFGKIKVVVISQALSIPFLATLGFSPWFSLSAAAYLIRVALMNMSSPVYNTFVMEQVEREARGTVASLVSMSWNFGWAFSPTVSGHLQVTYGFTPVFIGTITAYVIAIALYRLFFWHKSESTRVSEVPGAAR